MTHDQEELLTFSMGCKLLQPMLLPLKASNKAVQVLHSCEHCLQGLLTYTQLASILGMLNVQWPTVLQGLFKGFSWITHIAPKVPTPCCFPAAALLLFPTVDVLLPIVYLLPPTADQLKIVQPSLLLCCMAASLAVNAFTGWAKCDNNYID